MSDPIELLTKMWRAASYNHETVGIAIDALETKNKRIAELEAALRKIASMDVMLNEAQMAVVAKKALAAQENGDA